MGKIRVAIIGCGYWGQNLIRNFSGVADVEVAAACDYNLRALARVRRDSPRIVLKQDYDQILLDSRIHAVAIATPLSTHYAFAQRALRAGKHVLVEQPLATSTQQALELLGLADKHNRVLMVDHTFIYTGAVRHIKALVDAGELGKLVYFDSVRISLGIVQGDTNVIWDLAPHDFSILDHLCSQSPVAVSAVGTKSLGHPFENIAYLTAYFDGNMIAHIHVNWLAPVKVRKTLIGGTRKTIVFDDLEPLQKLKIYDACAQRDASGFGQEYFSRTPGMFAPILDTTEALNLVANEFVDAIKGERLAVSDGYAGYRVVRLLEAAQRSLQQGGRAVEVQDPLGVRNNTSSFVEVGA